MGDISLPEINGEYARVYRSFPINTAEVWRTYIFWRSGTNPPG